MLSNINFYNSGDRDRFKSPEQYVRENLDYYDGNTFKYWIGPSPASDDPQYQKVVAEIEKQYISVNIIAEFVDRLAAALVGNPFTWYLKGSDGERVNAPAAELLLQKWLDYIQQQSVNQECEMGDPWLGGVTNLLVLGTGQWRIFTPQKYANDPDPLKQVFLHAPMPLTVGMERDDDGFIDKIRYAYKGYSETQYQDPKKQVLAFDTTRSGEDKKKTTISKLIDNPRLYGRWTIYQATQPSLLTRDIKQLQNALNMTLTMLNRNIVQAGFVERIILNAQTPGNWVEDPEFAGRQKFVPSPEPMKFGAGVVNWLNGIPLGDPTNPMLTTPSVIYKDPVAVGTFDSTISIFRTLMYLLVGQGHLLSAGDGSLSGVSRIHIKQDYISYLDGKSKPIAAAISGVLGTVLRLLDPYGEFDNLEPVVKLNLNLGKLLPEERAMLIEVYQKSLLSRTTTMARLGDIEDTDAEIALIEEENRSASQKAVIS